MKKKLLLLLCLCMMGVNLIVAQISRVTGTVTSAEDDQPIIGASVLIKDTGIGTVTDIDGKFILSNIPSNAKKILISYVGMKPQEVSIKANLVIVMESDSEMIEEVVVTGMQRMDKRLFTGASDKLSGEATKLDGIPDISRALEGRSAGVSVQNVSGSFR